MPTLVDKIRENAEAMIRANEVYGSIAEQCNQPFMESVKDTMEQAMLAMCYAMEIAGLDREEMALLARQVDAENRARRALMKGGD